MASGSSGSKGFDFASDDILCSYEDYVNQESSNRSQSDPSIGANANKQDFQKSRISRSSVFPTTNAYNQPEESLSQEMITVVERTMKKYADNLMRFLEGISSRLSQLELYCYNLDKSIGEMRSDLGRDHGEADSKLKFLEKHLQEVHRSVQILRDKQELAETQKELAKLQLAQKESSAGAQDERATVSASETKNDDVSDTPNTQLALALPNQIAQQPSHPAAQQQSIAPSQPSSQSHSQMQSYYLPSNQLPNPQAQSHPSYLAADAQYRAPQIAPQAPQQSQTQASQTPQTQQYPQYQQWPQQVSQPMQMPHQPPVQPPQQSPMPPSQQPPMQPPNQIRAPAPQSNIYPPYMPSQPANPPPSEPISSSMPMQMSFQGMPQAGVNRAEGMPYGYGVPSRPIQPQPSPPHMKAGFSSQPGDGYATSGSHQPISSAGTYMLYDSEGGRSHHTPQPSHYSQGSYPPTNPSLPNMPPPNSNNLMIRSPAPQQYVRNHPYNELVDKLVSMGYRGDHVMSVIQRLEESGQPVDFNAVLDRLNGHSSGGSQRSW
ncbi:arginine-glutamic acid dipeptide repeats protein-like isoform X1 [Chenopodium quinoa]|uniref:arginine-glutamic acid dipeptide repeats protein-like isoform X1 n=1 Tax=Chenopodium quinoa TaxID=63459 RepID=UPI000B784F77|nr:arginine-glutamic acid dipeptide repeats protein-like isoform X1 [Chenopodium quinoa]